MAMKVDVHEVEEETKIRAKYLRALENEEYNLLPGNAYVKSFLRTYADYLGLDSRALVDLYRTQADAGEDDPAFFAQRSENAGNGSRRWVLLVVALVLIVLALFLIGTIGGGGS